MSERKPEEKPQRRPYYPPPPPPPPPMPYPYRPPPPPPPYPPPYPRAQPPPVRPQARSEDIHPRVSKLGLYVGIPVALATIVFAITSIAIAPSSVLPYPPLSTIVTMTALALMAGTLVIMFILLYQLSLYIDRRFEQLRERPPPERPIASPPPLARPQPKPIAKPTMGLPMGQQGSVNQQRPIQQMEGPLDEETEDQS